MEEVEKGRQRYVEFWERLCGRQSIRNQRAALLLLDQLLPLLPVGVPVPAWPVIESIHLVWAEGDPTSNYYQEKVRLVVCEHEYRIVCGGHTATTDPQVAALVIGHYIKGMQP